MYVLTVTNSMVVWARNGKNKIIQYRFLPKMVQNPMHVYPAICKITSLKQVSRGRFKKKKSSSIP